MAIQGKLGESTWPGHMLCSFCIIGIDKTKIEVDVEVLPGFSVFFFLPLSLDPILSSKLNLYRSRMCMEDFFNRTKLQWCGNSQLCWKIPTMQVDFGSRGLSAEWVTHLRFEWCYLQSVSYCHSPSASKKRVQWSCFAFLHSNHEYFFYLYEFETSVANPNGDLESAHVMGLNPGLCGWPFWIVKIDIEVKLNTSHDSKVLRLVRTPLD